VQRWGAVMLFAGLTTLGVGPAATSQEPGREPLKTYHHPHRKFIIPVNIAAIDQSRGRVTSLQLYFRFNGGKWQPATKYPLDELKALPQGKKGLNFTAEKDGEYEFSLRFWYPGGEVSPPVEDLTPILNVVIDTVLPLVRVVARGNGVAWEVSDANLDTRSIELQARQGNNSRWLTVTDGGEGSSPRLFRPVDRYEWALQPGQSLEVRVKARDQAGNETYSLPVRVPASSTVGAAFPRGGPDVGPDGGAFRDPLGGIAPPQSSPRIEYVKTKDFTVHYTVQRMGRSGIKSARLYVRSDRDAGGWKLAREFAVNLMPTDRDHTLPLEHSVKEDGGYGFFVALESGAGVKADPPKELDQPMLYVVVDTEKPFVKITYVRVSKGGARGPLVEIGWETQDRTLMAFPITLEYADALDAKEWKKIADRLPPGKSQGDSMGNTRYVGQYTWEIPDERVWKFYVRIRAVDRAENTTESVYPNVVLVDLEVPAAEITGVSGGARSGSPPAPLEATPVTPETVPAPPPMGPTNAPPTLPVLPPAKSPAETPVKRP
jgi:hypothetical protein